jgi:glycosyltransferase involved in cell wall biosynthesis
MTNSFSLSLPPIIIIGAFPPPVSGNSVHIARLYRFLKAKGYEVKVLDYRGETMVDDPPDVTRLSGRIWSKGLQVQRFMWGIPRDTIMHFHVSALGRFRWYAPMLLLATMGHKRVITIHSGRFMDEQTNALKKLYFHMLLSCFDSLVAVNEENRDSIISLGIRPNKVSVIPAYIKEEADKTFLPRNFLEIPVNKTKVVTSGTLIRIYNYEVLADVISNISQDKFHFIFAFYKNYEKQYEKEILDMLKGHSNVTIFRDLSPQEFLAVLSSSDIYVRTTTKEGDSVALREALALGKDVYATDYVWRPSGCVNFRESDELLQHLQLWAGDQQPRQSQTFDWTDKILELYSTSI